MVIEEAEKAFSPTVDLTMRRSVETHPTAAQGTGPNQYGVASGRFGPLFAAALRANVLPAWGANPFARDAMLRMFLPQESIAVSAIGSVVSKYASFTWTIDGPPRTSKKAHEMAHESQDGEGWQAFISLLAMDLLTQDRGAFVEAIRAGKAPDAAVIGFKCLDAASCHLTDDPRNPVLYHDRVSGKQTLMPWWSVYHLRQLPWHHSVSRGLQLSSLTRFYAYALVWKNITQIHAEKTGGRFSRAIHIIGGVTRPWLEDAMADQSKRADEAGQIAFQLPTLMTTVDPTATASVATIDLVALPDGFEKAEEFKEYVTVLAMALETDVQELAPLPSGQMGSAMQSQTLDQKSKAKGAANFRKLITHMMNHFLLPSNCEFAYDEQDIEEEGKEAVNSKTRAETRQIQVASQELDAAGARQQALDDGDISEELFRLMNERDLTYGALGEDQQIAQIDDTQSADAFALGLEMPGVPQMLAADNGGMVQSGQTPTPIRRRPPIFGGKGIPEARTAAEDEVTKMLMTSMTRSFAEFRKAIEAD